MKHMLLSQRHLLDVGGVCLKFRDELLIDGSFAVLKPKLFAV